jgi:hypothetical protein
MSLTAGKIVGFASLFLIQDAPNADFVRPIGHQLVIFRQHKASCYVPLLCVVPDSTQYEGRLVISAATGSFFPAGYGCSRVTTAGCA